MRKPMSWHTILILGSVVLIAGALVRTTGVWKEGLPPPQGGGVREADGGVVNPSSQGGGVPKGDGGVVNPSGLPKTKTPTISEEEYRKNIDVALADVKQALKTGVSTDELFLRAQKSILDLKVPAADKDWHLRIVLALNMLVNAAKGEDSLADATAAFQALFSPAD